MASAIIQGLHESTMTPIVKRKNRRLIYLSKPQLLALLKAAQAHSAKAHAMILLSYWHGLRTSEVCGLRLKDIDFKNRTIHLARLKGSLEHGQALSGLRGEPLLDEMKALKAWLDERATYQDHSDWLFVSQKGGRMDRSAFFRLFQQIAKDAGLPADYRNVRILSTPLARTGRRGPRHPSYCTGPRSLGAVSRHTITSV